MLTNTIMCILYKLFPRSDIPDHCNDLDAFAGGAPTFVDLAAGRESAVVPLM